MALKPIFGSIKQSPKLAQFPCDVKCILFSTGISVRRKLGLSNLFNSQIRVFQVRILQ